MLTWDLQRNKVRNNSNKHKKRKTFTMKTVHPWENCKKGKKKNMKLTLTKMLPVGYDRINMQPSISKQIPVSTFSKILNYSLKKVCLLLHYNLTMRGVDPSYKGERKQGLRSSHSKKHVHFIHYSYLQLDQQSRPS